MTKLRTGILLLFLGLIILPYIIVVLSTGPGYVFGGFFLNPMDGNTYLAKMRQGWEGSWQFLLPYTAEPGGGSYLFVLYLFLGHAARFLRLPLLLAFHLARMISAALLLLSLSRFFDALFPNRSTATLAYALAVLGAGMGWLGALLGWVSTDLWVAEAYPFLASFSNPHFPLGMAIMAWMLKSRIDSHRHPVVISQGAARGDLASFFRNGLWWALGGLLLALLSPFAAIVVGLVLAATAVWETAVGLPDSLQLSLARLPSLIPGGLYRLYPCLFLFLGAFPVMLYDFWIARANPALAGWNAQNITPTPPAWDVALSLSPALLLAFYGAWDSFRRGSPPILRSTVLLACWAAASLVLIFLPTSLQLRFSIGLFIPVAGLAALGAEALAAGNARRLRNLAVAVFMLSAPTLLFIQFASFFSLQAHAPSVFLTTGEAQVLSWIDERTPGRALVLAAPDMGLFIPAYTGRRVIYGHPFETANAAVEKMAVTRFFADPGMSDVDRRAFLEKRGVDYILYGPREQSLGSPVFLQTLTPLYNTGGVILYAAR